LFFYIDDNDAFLMEPPLRAAAALAKFSIMTFLLRRKQLRKATTVFFHFNLKPLTEIDSNDHFKVQNLASCLLDDPSK
jgi:hypothetical protein